MSAVQGTEAMSFGLTGATRLPNKPKSPLIAANPKQQPPPMTTGGQMIAGWEGVWFVAHTRSRFEKALAWDLHRQGVNYFLPMEDVVVKSGGKKREQRRLLFPGYVFFCGDDDDRYIALTTNRICQIIVACNQSALRNDMVNWHAGLIVDHPPLTQPTMLPGRRVQVRKAGHPFDGLYGTIVKTANGAQIELDVEMLGRVCAFEIDPDLVEFA